MYTACPSCHTVFRIRPDQLGVANGLVRCGVCDESFRALGRLYEDLSDVPQAAEDAQTVGAAQQEKQRDRHTTSAQDRTGAVHAAVDGQEPAEPCAENVRLDAPVRQADAAQAQRSEPQMPAEIAVDEDGAQLHLSADELPPVLKADLQAQAQRRSPAMLALGVLVVLILLAGLGVQYVYYQRRLFVENPTLRPWMVRACAVLACEVPLPHDPQRIELLTRDVRSDPDANHALLISAVFVNRAPYRQAYPLLGLRFSNFTGTLVAARYFRPVEYLPANVDTAKGIASGATAHVRFVINDPGTVAVSYQFNFR